jgi:molecular chaperone GrpE
MMAGEDEKPQTSNEAAPNGPDTASVDGAPREDAAAKLEQEKKELTDKLLRTLAEMENLRRRTEKEVADTRAYAISAFARDMLSVADNLRRALETVPGEARKTEGGLASLIEGVELTERELAKVLERHGVRKLDPAGEKFDPNLHQAMFEAPHDNLAKGQVHTVVQPGYAIGERVLRPALVGVSSGAAANDRKGRVASSE